MKRLLMVVAVMLTATTLFSQSTTNNLYWTLTVKVKMDKRQEYEKKLVPFLKTHYPNAKVRCWEVLTGENTGAYVFVMGPTSYKEMDVPMVSPKGEGQIKIDALALDALTESKTTAFARRIDAVSVMKPDRKLKYIQVATSEVKIGTWSDYRGIMVKSLDARKKGGSKVDYDVFRPSNSGTGNAFSVVTHVEKLEDLDLTEEFTKMYDALHGDNAAFKDTQWWNDNMTAIRFELRVLRSDLSQL